MQTLLPSCPCEVWEKGGSDLKKQTPSYCAGLWSPLEVKSLSSAEAPTENSNKNKRTVIIYRPGEGGGENFRGSHLILGEQKGDQSQLRNQKRESLKTLKGFKGATTQIYLENEDKGGDRESHQKVITGVS